MSNKIGDVIKKLRIAKGISQYKMADDLKVAQSTIGMYEANRRVPEAEMIKKISDYFQVPIDELLGQGLYIKKDLIMKYMDMILDRMAADLDCSNEREIVVERSDGSPYNDGKPMKYAEFIKSIDDPEIQFKVLTAIINDVIIDEDTMEMSLIYYI